MPICAITGVKVGCLNSFAVSTPLDSGIEPVDLASLEAVESWAQQQIIIRDREALRLKQAIAVTSRTQQWLDNS